MTTSISKPWAYDMSMEKCVGSVGNDLWFTAKSTDGDSSDSLHVYIPTDLESLQTLSRAINILLFEHHGVNNY
jgi:hypothetical protein